MNGKEFKRIINEMVGDDDSIAIMDKHCGNDCLFDLKKEHIRKEDDGDSNCIIISVRDIKDTY